MAVGKKIEGEVADKVISFRLTDSELKTVKLAAGDVQPSNFTKALLFKTVGISKPK